MILNKIMKSVLLLSFLIALSYSASSVSESGWSSACDEAVNPYQSPIDFDDDNEDDWIKHPHLTYSAAEFLTAKDVKNDYNDGVASFKKETGNFKITRHNHYDYDVFDYITFETFDHDFKI